MGIYGHRNQTSNRGPGDPGDFIFQALLNAGYKGFNYDTGEDLTFWKGQQTRMGLQIIDNVAGHQIQTKLLQESKTHGLWTPRPNN